MTLSRNKVQLLFILLSVFYFTNKSEAQNYYNLENTRKFADYLYKTKQFDLASLEYERVVFLDSMDWDSKFRLIETYRLSQKYAEGLLRYNHFFPDVDNKVSQRFANEYIKLLLLDKSFDKASNFLSTPSNLSNNEITDYKLSTVLLQQNWQQAKQFALSNPPTGTRKNMELILLANQSAELDYKSPAVGALMSTIIPGSGKMYAGNWKDGLISLLFIAGNSWNAYSGFRKYGEKSAYGWIFGSITFGFYLGNIYGSFKEVKFYNTRLDEQMLKKAESVIYSDF